VNFSHPTVLQNTRTYSFYVTVFLCLLSDLLYAPSRIAQHLVMTSLYLGVAITLNYIKAVVLNQRTKGDFCLLEDIQ
jgi:hypothetical protein